MVKTSSTSVGTLYIVATPIGNRDDISLRALTTLKTVDAILAEDTRHSGQLLNLLNIHKPLLSLHAHNESNKTNTIIEILQQGKSLALITDAGTPLISDPGFPLVRRARELQIPVVPIPGPCALITALSAAGVACDSFTFVGFLPAKSAARRAKLASFLLSEHTIVFYESTHRLLSCLDDLIDIYGPSYELVVAKELTKAFEQFIAGTGPEIKNWFLADAARCKGEFVIILPVKIIEDKSNYKEMELLSLLLEELSVKEATKIASLLTKRNKNELYQLALKLKEKEQ